MPVFRHLDVVRPARAILKWQCKGSVCYWSFFSFSPQHKLHNHNFYLDKIKVLEIVRKLESLAYYINKIATILILGDESRLCTSSSWRTKRHRDEYAFYFCPYYIITKNWHKNISSSPFQVIYFLIGPLTCRGTQISLAKVIW